MSAHVCHRRMCIPVSRDFYAPVLYVHIYNIQYKYGISLVIYIYMGYSLILLYCYIVNYCYMYNIYIYMIAINHLLTGAQIQANHGFNDVGLPCRPSLRFDQGFQI